jgi:glycosyltransferase involved in cell wall biosynthesis
MNVRRDIPMRLFVHDFAGHPYAPQLSRTLAAQGHEVVHGYCGGVATGQGDLERKPGDAPGLRFVDVSSEPFERYAPLGRLRSEVRYGRRLAALVRNECFDAVVSANCPLAAQAQLWRAAASTGARRVYWLQDFLGRGTRAVLAARSRLLGATLGAAWERLEAHLLRRADHVIVITDDFVEELAARHVTSPATVIQNWTPLDEVPVRPKRNAWSREHGLDDRPVALYAGTLGHKHDPEHLVALARLLEPSGAVTVVATEGLGREHLEQRRRELQLEHLVLMDYVPWEVVPDMLGAADVVLTLLEPDAGTFSAPSKVLTYLAAGRPIVGAMPVENLAATTVAGAGAGLVVAPGDHDGFASAVAGLLADPARAAAMGSAGRAHAEEHFDIGAIAERFLAVVGPPARSEDALARLAPLRSIEPAELPAH